MPKYILEDLTNLWGGRMPTWEQFKQASKDGRVRANKTIAARVIFAKEVPLAYKVLYGVITLWLGFLIFPVTSIAWFFMDFSAWWILGSFIAARFLVTVSREGHCEGMKEGAESNKEFYEMLVNNGAFLFSPERLEN